MNSTKYFLCSDDEDEVPVKYVDADKDEDEDSQKGPLEKVLRR